MKNLYRIPIIILLSVLIMYSFNLNLDAATSTNELTLNLNVLPYVSLELPDSLSMKVTVNNDSNVTADVSFRTNCKVSIKVESTGFGDGNELLNSYVTYQLDDYDAVNPLFTRDSINVEAGTTYSGTLTVNWLGSEFSTAEWQEITSGTYSDTITVTISYPEE